MHHPANIIRVSRDYHAILLFCGIIANDPVTNESTFQQLSDRQQVQTYRCVLQRVV